MKIIKIIVPSGGGGGYGGGGGFGGGGGGGYGKCFDPHSSLEEAVLCKLAFQ